MDYSGNWPVDFYYYEYNKPIMKKEKAYFCPSCECYYDFNGNEINRFDAVDFYDIETSECGCIFLIGHIDK